MQIYLTVFGPVNQKIDRDNASSIVIMCQAKDMCQNYSAAVKDCATAGNIENCLKIKIGEEKYSTSRQLCKRDRNSTVYKFENEPTASECALVTFYNK